MGKIILSEGQYEKLKSSLISNTINESNNQKSQILNEVGYYKNYIDVDFVNLTLTLNNYLDFERKGGGSELRLNKGVVFKRTGGVGSNLVANNVPFQLVGDYTGGLEEKGRGTITYYCKSNNLDIKGRNAIFYPENVNTSVLQGFKDLCSQKPYMGPKGSTSGEGGGGVGKGSLNERYWTTLFSELVKSGIGAKLDKNNRFIYWGPWVVNRDMGKNGGYPIWDSKRQKFYKFLEGNYAGQPMKNIYVIEKSTPGVPLKLKDVIGGKTTTSVSTTSTNVKPKKVSKGTNIPDVGGKDDGGIPDIG